MRTAGEIIRNKSLYFAKSGETVFEVAKLMAEKNVGAVPVPSKDGKLLGIFSERDLLTFMPSKG